MNGDAIGGYVPQDALSSLPRESVHALCVSLPLIMQRKSHHHSLHIQGITVSRGGEGLHASDLLLVRWNNVNWQRLPRQPYYVLIAVIGQSQVVCSSRPRKRFPDEEETANNSLLGEEE